MNQTISTPHGNFGTRLSFHQKSTLASLIIVLGVAIYFFAKLIEMVEIQIFLLGDVSVPTGYWMLVVWALIAMVFMELVIQALLALRAAKRRTHNQQSQNQAWRNASTKAARNAYPIVTCGLVMAIVGLLMDAAPFVVANGLLFFLLMAEVVKLASQLIYSQVEISK